MATKARGDRSGTAAEPPIFDILSATPHFRPPAQARSNEKTHAILAAAAGLLCERPYASIRMQDVADRAGCAVTAIYARFADKDGLLSAIHVLKLQESRLLLGREMQPEHFRDTGLRGLADAFVRVNDHYFDENFNLVIAQMTSGSGNAFRATASILDDYALRLAGVAAAAGIGETGTLVEPIKFAIRTVLSIYWGGALAAGYLARPSAATMAEIFVLIVERRLTD